MNALFSLTSFLPSLIQKSASVFASLLLASLVLTSIAEKANAQRRPASHEVIQQHMQRLSDRGETRASVYRNVLDRLMRGASVPKDGLSQGPHSSRVRERQTTSVRRAASFAKNTTGLPRLSADPDQLYYTELAPVGDVTGDGFADALEIDIFTARLYVGQSGTAGFAATSVSFSLSNPPTLISGGGDLNGDGAMDAVLTSEFTDQVDVIFGVDGGTPVTDVQRRAFTLSPTGSEYAVAIADLDPTDASDRASLVRLNTDGGDGFIATVARLDTDENLIVDQQPSLFPDTFVLASGGRGLRLANVSGDDRLELVFGSPTTNTFIADPTGTTTLRLPQSIPIGDADGDGREDFYYQDGDGAFITFGRETLSDLIAADGGLQEDLLIPQNPDEDAFISDGDSFLPSGDVNGDGRGDVILSSQIRETLSRRFVSVSAQRQVSADVNVALQLKDFFADDVSTISLGDFNADGVEDLAVLQQEARLVHVFYGGASISETPDLTLSTTRPSSPLYLTALDFNADGRSDLVVGYDTGTHVDVYFGGSSALSTPDHTISAQDVTGRDNGVYAPQFVGDVNGDGVDDLLVSTIGFPLNALSGTQVFVFYGDATPPELPGTTISYPDNGFGFVFLGEHSVFNADVNADGIDDLIFSDELRPLADGGGAVDVFFGSRSLPTSISGADADLTLTNVVPANASGDGLSYGAGTLAAGDYTGDGITDVIAAPQFNTEDGVVSLFEGGTGFDDVPDRQYVLNGDLEILDTPLSSRNAIRSTFHTLNDPIGAGIDGLVIGQRADFDASVIWPSGSGIVPIAFLDRPNADAKLGGQATYHTIAVRDFDGDGVPDVVAPQFDDDNDAFRSGRTYRYALEGAHFPEAVVRAGVSSSTPEADLTGSDTPFASVRFDDRDGGTLSGAGELIVQRFDERARSTGDVTESIVSEFRFVLSTTPGFAFGGVTLVFDRASLVSVGNPETVVAYGRSTLGTGPFVSLPTRYDAASNTIAVETNDLGEFILASDDSDNPLPVELATFNAELRESGQAQLTWTTASETNNAGFAVEHQPPRQSTWNEADFVDGAGTSSQAQTYRTVLDVEAPGTHRFRLRQVDLDGTEHVSRETSIEVDLSAAYVLTDPAPNPSPGTARLQLTVRTSQDVTVDVYDVLGQRVKTVTRVSMSSNRPETIHVDGQRLAPGVYWVRVRGDTFSETRKLVVVR